MRKAVFTSRSSIGRCIRYIRIPAVNSLSKSLRFTLQYVGSGNAFGKLEQRWYAPLQSPSLLVHEMTFSADSGSSAMSVRNAPAKGLCCTGKFPAVDP